MKPAFLTWLQAVRRHQARIKLQFQSNKPSGIV